MTITEAKTSLPQGSNDAHRLSSFMFVRKEAV